MNTKEALRCSNEARTLTKIAAAQTNSRLAQPQFEAAIAVFRELGNRNGEMAVLANLGTLHRREHRLAASLQSYDQAIALNKETKNPRALATSRHLRGTVLKEQGDLDAARRSFEASLATFRQMEMKSSMPIVLIALAELAALRGDFAQAQKLAREAEAMQPPGEKVQTRACAGHSPALPSRRGTSRKLKSSPMR